MVTDWMWSMVFSLAFLSIFHFGYLWLADLLAPGGAAFTAAVFREAERHRGVVTLQQTGLNQVSRYVWKPDSEA